MEQLLHGRTAVVTGGGSGIGRRCATVFAEQGAAVLVVDQDGDGASVTVAEIEAAGGQAAKFEADVTDDDAAHHGIEVAKERFGGVDVLLTAAGISVGRTVTLTDPPDWRRVLDVNLTGTYLWMRSAIPAMVDGGGGSVILISSQLGVAGGVSNAAYIASKGAVIALARTSALDYAADGVRVNSILPGATETPLLDRSFGRLADPDSARARSLSRHPMGRFGTVDEIAAAALYLASDQSSFTTGSELRVDGGWLAG